MLRTIRRRLAAALLALPFLAPHGSATWSIVVCDTGTGEVCVASATCLANFDLRRFVPMVVVGVGGAAAQSATDSTAQNRQFIRARMEAGFTPRFTLWQLSTVDPNHQSRQYGIVTLEDNAMSWTGSNAGHARHGITGNYTNENGDLVRYAVQGNLLTGDVVVEAARWALIHTKGDLSQKVMSAMEAARAMGGDGRCSCSPASPQGCGAPPDDFDKSAHVAFMVLARMGDTDGTCDVQNGCANGEYYMNLQQITGMGGPDPVHLLRAQYADWRATWVGRPDQQRSTTSIADASLPADGSSQTTVTVQLVDVEGDPLMNGGALLSIDWTGAGPAVALAGPVSDHGGGHYSFPLTATTIAGPGSFSVTVDDGLGAVRLWPDVLLSVE